VEHPKVARAFPYVDPDTAGDLRLRFARPAAATKDIHGLAPSGAWTMRPVRAIACVRRGRRVQDEAV